MEFCYAFSWESATSFINSQFFSSMSGALAGAFAGAIAAHSIATGARRREDAEGQIRAINAAIMSAFLICNSMLSIKRQQVLTMHKKFHEERARYEQSLAAPAGTIIPPFEMDMEFVGQPHVPIDVLGKQVYEKMNLKGRALGLVPAISNALSMFQSRAELRNKLIEKYKEDFKSMGQKERLDHYFGFPLAGGSVHREFADCLDGINSYTNDVIFFSSLLCQDLAKHGNEIRDSYVKKYHRDIEQISSMNFDTPKAKDLMPSPEDYADWLTMFASLPKKSKKPWYWRFW